MSTTAPIEIIGGGLAGLSLGLALQQHGVPTTIFEAGDYPRHRVCGEFITGLGATTMMRLNLEPFLGDALQHREVAWFMPGEPARVQRLPAAALGLSRHALDARLAAAFVQAGGTLQVRQRIQDGTASGRVFATGRRLGRSAWLGLKLHVRGLALERDLELHLGDHGYVGLCRVESERVNVCGLFRQRELSVRGPPLLLRYLHAAGLPALAGRIERAEPCGESFCAVAALNFQRRVQRAADVVRLGDACAMVPPFTGNGMAMAFQSAEVALDPLLAFARGETGWIETCRTIAAGLQARFRMRLASADAMHPFLLQPRRQHWLATLSRARLLPFGTIYAALH